MKYKAIIIKTRKPEYYSERLEICATNYWIVASIKAKIAAFYFSKVPTLFLIKDCCVSIYIEESHVDLFGEPRTGAFHIFDNFS